MATTGTITPTGYQTELDGNGKPINGALIYTYASGTTTAIATYSDYQLTTPNANPIVADLNGRWSAFLVAGVSYKFLHCLPVSPVPPPTSPPSAYETVDHIIATPIGIVVFAGTLGQSITAGQGVYLSDGSGGKQAGDWFLWDSANTYSSTLPVVGFALQSGNTNDSIQIQVSARCTVVSGLVAGTTYYAGTSGALTSSAPANARAVGVADTATSLVMTANPAPPASGLTPPVMVTAATDGELLIGKTSDHTLNLATLTAGVGIQITNAAAAITIANGVINRGANTVVNNTALETTAYSFSVPGGTLSTNRVLHTSMVGQLINVTGAGANMIVRVKYGSVTIYQGQLSNVNTGVNGGHLNIDVELCGNGTTGSQVSKTAVDICGTDVTAGGVATTIDVVGGFSGGRTFAGGITQVAVDNNIAVDSTAANTFAITFQMSTASPNLYMYCLYAYSEVK